jgi:hypothetical protein
MGRMVLSACAVHRLFGQLAASSIDNAPLPV